MTGSALKIVHEINPEGLPDYLEGEREALGTDHCVIGGALARHWGLPAVLRSTIEHHHDPSRADPEYVTMAKLVQLGDLIAMVTEQELGFERLSKYLEGQEDLNGLASDLDLAQVIEEVGKEFQNTRNVLFEDATEVNKP
jgi:HD-like signal output (HDOD) protein